jgi:hypothetical protein
MLAPFGERKYGPIARALLDEIGPGSKALLIDAVGTPESAQEVADVVGPDVAASDVWTFPELLLSGPDAGPDIEVPVELRKYNGELGPAAGKLSVSVPTLQAFLDPIVEKALQNDVWQLSRLAYTVENLLKQRGVRVGYVMSSRLPPILTVIQAARQLRIPTLEPQSVLYGRGVTRQKAPAGDFVCAIDTYARDLFQEHYGVDAGRIIVAGSTRIDDFKRAFDTIDRGLARRRIAPKTGPAVSLILFATQPLPIQANVRALRSLLKTVLRNPGMRLIVKLHPTEPHSSFRSYTEAATAAGAREFCYVTRTDDTYHLMAACDLIVTMTSNVALEAAVFDLPVLVIDPDAVVPPIDFERMNVALAAKSLEAVPGMIEEILARGEAHARLARMRAILRETNPQLLDGKTAGRIVSFARSVAAGTVPARISE